MTHSNAPILPPVNADHRRIAVGKFERANQVITTGNFDYGIHLLMDCCKLDPGSLPYRKKLRATEKVKYRNNLRGSVFAGLTCWPIRARMKAAFRAGDYLKVLEHGERILMRNPWDVGAQMGMSEAAEMLGLLDLAVWILEQARHKKALNPHLNRALARLYEKRGNFTQAIALWELIRKAKPGDVEALHKIKDLAADDTIARGQFHASRQSNEETGEAPVGGTDVSPVAAGGTGISPVAGKRPKKDSTAEVAAAWWSSQSGTPAPKTKASSSPALPSDHGEAPGNDRLEREAAPLRARLKDDPTSPYLYLQLAAVYRRGDALDKARAVVREGLGPTGNAFELSVQLADLDIEPFRRNLVIAEEKLKAAPDHAELRRLRTRLRKEINTRELEMYRLKADRYPTEMSHRYEVGVRLLRIGQIDEAIHELQASRGDPRYRWQSLLALGQCFKTRNNWRLAERNFEEALKNLPGGEMNPRKEILYELAAGCAEANELSKAIDLATELANIDFSYRDIGRLLDEWQTRVQQANVSE
ncbi:MAG: tetratricopeptide repeat protein [Gemmataceae bacterium]